MSQRAWDTPCLQATVQSLLDNVPDEKAKARNLAITTKESVWLHGVVIVVLLLTALAHMALVAIGVRDTVFVTQPLTTSFRW